MGTIATTKLTIQADNTSSSSSDISIVPDDEILQKIASQIKSVRDPGFVRDFKSRGNALLAVRLIMDHQKADEKYLTIINYPGFRSLFTDEWSDKSDAELIIKMKNMVRDLRDSNRSFCDDWAEAKQFFISRKRV